MDINSKLETKAAPYRKSILVKAKPNDDFGFNSESQRTQHTKHKVTIVTPEQTKLTHEILKSNETSSATPKAPFSNKIEKLKTKMEHWESYLHYFASYQVHNHDSIVDAYIKHGASILQWIDIDTRESLKFSKRSTRNKTTTLPSLSHTDELMIDDIRMECWDRVPHADRPNFPISQVIDLLPHLLFSANELRIETSRSVKDEISSTSVYLSSVGEYMYVSGLLMYEDLSQYQEANASMKELKHKQETKNLNYSRLKSWLASTPKSQSKSPVGSFGSGRTVEPLNFPNLPLMHLMNSEGSHQSNLVWTNLIEIEENENDCMSDSEEEKDDFETEVKPTKSVNQFHKASTIDQQDSKDTISFHLNTLKRSESLENKADCKRVKMPKVIVLISKYPIYEDMEEFLKKIKLCLTDWTSVSFESMILNLIYEFPHPGDKHIVQSNFWKTRRKTTFSYEVANSLPYWDSKYFIEFYNYQEKLHIIWSIIEKMLFARQILIVSKSKFSLIAWSEILK